ncbi:MAG TPA: DUF4395 domain-containing protein [Acidimicrobiales bacterium]
MVFARQPGRTDRWKSFFAFPDPVNEVSARVVAGGVVILAVATLASRQLWLLVPIAYGFFARVLTGPTLSPLGQLATRVVTPRLPVAPRPVAGPPKRFAQAMGLAMSSVAAILGLGFGERTAAFVLTALIVVAATLESGFRLCLGCKVFALLMRLGLIPAEVCERCNNIGGRPSPAG